MVMAGLAFLLGWNHFVHHANSWGTGEDLWGIFRGAHFVGWGYLGGIYTPTNGINSFPGIEVLLAPVAMLSSHLHLTESYPPYMVARPTAALILQPVEVLLASTTVFASDALARRLGTQPRRRLILCGVVGTFAWLAAAVWGHSEDPLALTFAVYAMLAVFDRKWSKCGWLLGLGIVMQPLVGLLLPLVLASTPAGKRLSTAFRSLALSAVLVGVAFIGNPGDTYRSVVQQPTPPSVNHATPWVALAPKLGAVGNSSGLMDRAGLHSGRGFADIGPAVYRGSAMVAGGPGRLIDLVLAVLVGLFAWRRPQSGAMFVWLAALVLCSRCFFEAVMTPYYLAPPLILALVAASSRGGKRFWPTAILAVEVTIFSYHHLNSWVWWLPVVAGLVAILALGYPGVPASATEPAGIVEQASIALERDEPQLGPVSSCPIPEPVLL